MNIPVLIIGFNRPRLLLNQISLLSNLGVEEIYVAIDGGRDTEEHKVCLSIAQMAINYETKARLYVRVRDQNIGCGLGVISALDWFFSSVTEGIVLEDDCVPNQATFEFFEKNRSKLNDMPNLGIITAHNPCSQTSSDIYSKYIFINGWMTTSKKYKLVRENLFCLHPPALRKILNRNWLLHESIFWWATSARVKLGRHDTWDSPFFERFTRLDFVSLVPQNNLIQNVGFGEGAAHTKNPDGTIFLDRMRYQSQVTQKNFDKIVKKYYFQIRIRHAVSPFLRVAKDFLAFKRKKFEFILSEDANHQIYLDREASK